jgi:hypothetical protein
LQLEAILDKLLQGTLSEVWKAISTRTSENWCTIQCEHIMECCSQECQENTSRAEQANTKKISQKCYERNDKRKMQSLPSKSVLHFKHGNAAEKYRQYCFGYYNLFGCAVLEMLDTCILNSSYIM